MHLWFATLHPFDDGNGRIGRALTDMALAQADEHSIRLLAKTRFWRQYQSARLGREQIKVINRLLDGGDK